MINSTKSEFLKQISLSVIIVALDEEKRLPFVLTSLEKQKSVGNNLEVILVDNGSKDNTLGIMQEFCRKHKYAKVYVYSGSVSAAYSVALRKSSGEYIILIDADMAFPTNWFESIIGMVRKNQDYDAFVARQLPFFRYRSFLNDYAIAYYLGDTAKEGEWKEHTFNSGGLVVRRDIALKVDFDPRLSIAYDGDFSYRFLSEGYKAYYSPKRHLIFDEQYYSMSDLMSYFKKRGISEVVLLRSCRTTRIIKVIFKALLEPFTPHYLFTRYRKARKFTKVSYHKWLLGGFAIFLFMVCTLTIYGPIGKSLPNKILRMKI